jgi:hypothetical protein
MNLELKNLKYKRNRTLFLLGLLGIISGFSNAVLYNQPQLLEYSSIVASLIAIAIIYYWIIYDAKVRNYRIPKYLKYLIILFSIVGVPIYFWQTRSFKNFFLNLGGLWLFAFFSFIYSIFFYITIVILFDS